MPEESPIICALARRLAELGLRERAVRRIVRETAEHYHDLLRAALARGLPPAEAKQFADQRLGDPVMLAELHWAASRRSLLSRPWALPSLAPLPFVFAVGCPFFTFLAAFFAFEFVQRAVGRSRELWLVCAVTLLEAGWVHTGTLNAATPWLTALLVYAGRGQVARRQTSLEQGAQHA